MVKNIIPFFCFTATVSFVTADDLCVALVNEYGINTDVAMADVTEFVALLKEHGLIINE